MRTVETPAEGFLGSQRYYPRAYRITPYQSKKEDWAALMAARAGAGLKVWGRAHELLTDLRQGRVPVEDAPELATLPDERILLHLAEWEEAKSAHPELVWQLRIQAEFDGRSMGVAWTPLLDRLRSAGEGEGEGRTGTRRGELPTWDDAPRLAHLRRWMRANLNAHHWQAIERFQSPEAHQALVQAVREMKPPALFALFLPEGGEAVLRGRSETVSQAVEVLRERLREILNTPEAGRDWSDGVRLLVRLARSGWITPPELVPRLAEVLRRAIPPKGENPASVEILTWVRRSAASGGPWEAFHALVVLPEVDAETFRLMTDFALLQAKRAFRDPAGTLKSLIDAPSAGPAVWRQLVEEAMPHLVAVSLASHPRARWDKVVRPRLLESADAEVLKALVIDAQGEEFRLSLLRLAEQYPYYAAVMLAKARPEQKSALTTLDLQVFLSSEDARVRLLGVRAMGERR